MKQTILSQHKGYGTTLQKQEGREEDGEHKSSISLNFIECRTSSFSCCMDQSPPNKTHMISFMNAIPSS